MLRWAHQVPSQSRRGLSLRIAVSRGRHALDLLCECLAALPCGRGQTEVEVRPVVQQLRPGLEQISKSPPGRVMSAGFREPKQHGRPRISIRIEAMAEPRQSLAGPQLVTWAAGTPDVDGVAAAARAAGFGVIGPRNGSRQTPGGSMLRWRSAAVDAGFAGPDADPVPFFIEWAAETSHPSASAPPGLRLVAVTFRHPDPPSLRAALATLGIDAAVDRADTPGLGATFDTPRGHIVL